MFGYFQREFTTFNTRWLYPLEDKSVKSQRAGAEDCWQRTIPNKWALYLLNQFNTLLEIHAEIDEGPLNTLTLVFFLLQDEHVVVEELLQLFVGEVDTKLLEAVVLRFRKGRIGIRWLVIHKHELVGGNGVPKKQFSYCFFLVSTNEMDV